MKSLIKPSLSSTAETNKYNFGSTEHTGETTLDEDQNPFAPSAELQRTQYIQERIKENEYGFNDYRQIEILIVKEQPL